ncbi:Stress up-regulated Nod 19 [Seminavis robusta]|uniref:Stress up-regulated Nod 19 n=1 Tax=Seminavis robusta TaxID=568900 RepID=A0A9N8EM92_9STRA|nr:Stress up-regulated Nod 19 [Seminavis robusta]|eukprot:Sro1458_g274410.1 Stress up-regulated Nod 19 (812) ;mRNA; r:12873-15308
MMLSLEAPTCWALLLLSFLPVQLASAKNMNNGVYHIANPAATKDGSPGYSTEYQTEYFEVYSAVISTYYSQVYWALLDPVKLPEHILKRFANKTMAIVGYEVDQVQVQPDGTEIPVPITHAYNHHYLTTIWDSTKVELVKRSKPTHYGHNNGHGEPFTFEDLSPQQGPVKLGGVQIPSKQSFFEGNGAEMRLSYHGYPKGYAQLVHNPDSWSIYVMQIDTWNREESSPKFKPGPLPKSSPVYNDSTATYSGLLECPCNDKMLSTKVYYKRYKSLNLSDEHQCVGQLRNASECWEGGQFVAPTPNVRTHMLKGDDSKPPFCSVRLHDDGALDVFWNDMADSVLDHHQVREDPSKVIGFVSNNAINASVSLDSGTNAATLTLVGPADAWFGMALGTDTMCNEAWEGDECPETGAGPYAIIVSGDSVQERNLAFHGKGVILPPSIKVISNTVEGGNRTVVITRSLQGADDRYFSFDSRGALNYQVPVIVARGCSLTFAQHCQHGSTMLNFIKVETPLQICQDGIVSQIGGRNFEMDGRCPPEASSLFEQKNPSCWLDTYQGGLSCCHHLQTLLDSDQYIPWKDQLLEYQIKFRYYFEEYVPAKATAPPSHQNLYRIYRQTESFAGEYDVVQCPPGTPPSQCVHQITARFSVLDLQKDSGREDADGIQLVYAGPHCHAPSCLSMELYNADTGHLLCRSEPIKGQSTDRVYDELGYIAIPPCLWGYEEGLMDPIFLPSNATLLAIKRNNNTLLHTGEMASWQCRGVFVVNKKTGAETGDRGKAVNKEKTMFQIDVAENDEQELNQRSRRGSPEVPV